METVDELVKNIISRQLKMQEEFFENALRNNAEPPIKGEITKGKIKWRGIRLITINTLGSSCSWLEQRGKQISDKLYLNFKI